MSHRARLLRRDDGWAAASEGRDREHILSYLTEDAAVVPPASRRWSARTRCDIDTWNAGPGEE